MCKIINFAPFVDSLGRPAIGLTIGTKNISLAVLANYVEDIRMPKTIARTFPALTNAEWSAFTRLVTMIFAAMVHPRPRKKKKQPKSGSGAQTKRDRRARCVAENVRVVDLCRRRRLVQAPVEPPMGRGSIRPRVNRTQLHYRRAQPANDRGFIWHNRSNKEIGKAQPQSWRPISIDSAIKLGAERVQAQRANVCVYRTKSSLIPPTFVGC